MSIETPAPAPAEAATPAPVAGESTASDPETPLPADLRDEGKKAIDAMKAERREAREAAAAEKARADALQAKLDGKEAEFAAEQERRKVEDAALAKANERIRKAEVRAAAAGKLTDPTDALRYLDLEQFEVGNDGEVDTAAITAAIENLVKSKPYLAAQGGTPGTVFESPGAHREGSPAGQIGKAELDRMSPAEINAARKEGRLNDLMGVKR